MKHIEIRRVTSNDIILLQGISTLTFSETFSSLNKEENMRKYLAEGFSLPKLTNELNDYNSEFYFAEQDKRITGYLKLNFGESQTELKDPRAMEIERIYILKEFQAQKIGQLLCEKAIAVAQERHLNFIWLGVWEKNYRAINFYKKNGFLEFDRHVFMLGDDAQTDIMMKRELDKTTEPVSL